MERLWPAAREAGFAGLGAFPFTEFSAWLETLSGRPGYEEFPSWRGLANAGESLPTARSIVVAAWDYSRIPVPPLTGKVARLYLTFSDPPDLASHPGARHLLEVFDRLGWKATTKVPRREAAVAAGLLVQRKNCLGYLECKVREKYAPGNHTLFVGEIVDARMLSAGRPMSTLDYPGFYMGKE